jgi:hypothetical protein
MSNYLTKGGIFEQKKLGLLGRVSQISSFLRIGIVEELDPHLQ